MRKYPSFRQEVAQSYVCSGSKTGSKSSLILDYGHVSDKIGLLWGGGGIGRRRGLKILRWRHLVGSSPTRPTNRPVISGWFLIYLRDSRSTSRPLRSRDDLIKPRTRSSPTRPTMLTGVTAGLWFKHLVGLPTRYARGTSCPIGHSQLKTHPPHHTDRRYSRSLV